MRARNVGKKARRAKWRNEILPLAARRKFCGLPVGRRAEPKVRAKDIAST